MAAKKRPGERWFTLAPNAIWEEHETPEDDTYIPKDGIVLGWSVLVVKASVYKIICHVKVGDKDKNTWAALTGWEVTSVQAMGDYTDVVLENSSLQIAHLFFHQFSEPFDAEHAKESCVEPEVIKPESIFIDASVSNTKVASRFTKLKHALTLLNKALQSKPKPQQPVRRKATPEEGAGSSRPLSIRKPKPVPADSRRGTPTETPAESENPTPSDSRQTTPSDSRQTTPSGSRQATPSKRQRESSVMTDEPVSPELKMPKAGEAADTKALAIRDENFEAKCLNCFFMGREYKFQVNIAQCHLAPPEKCVRAKEDDYVQWIITKMLAGSWKGDRQTIVVMPQGLKKMPTPDMWPTISKGDFWLIDGQHSVEASKKIQNMTEGVSQKQKDKLKVWDALVVWSDNETMLSDISRYFNSTNMVKLYQPSWIRNIIASRDVWEFYKRPPRERENAPNKTSKWEVSLDIEVWVDRPKLFLFGMCFSV
jgi:hypothetical protein